ncbi:MAG TPA: CHAD domain-containing protein [Thermoleophilaceae bacterium]|nr:CHAD domain-containing protein [Thermoleophilaceae bacterium]
MKARKVKGLEPSGSLRENAGRIIETRTAELHSFDPRGDSQELHAMRIAAKRLRYILELTAPALGADAERGAKQAKALQTLLGELHDCDVMLELIFEHVSALREQDAATALDLAPPDAEDLSPDAARALPNRSRYRGLEAAAAYFAARRELMHRRFLEKWEELEPI